MTRMDKKMCGALLVAAALALGGCSKKAEFQASEAVDARGGAMGMTAPAPMPMAPPPEANMKTLAAADAVAGSAAVEAPVRRFLAVRHDLQIFTVARGVEAAWRTANDACAAARCEVLASSLARNGQRQPIQASLDARVPPDKLDEFLTRVTGLGTVGRHDKTAQDKTDEVIDTEARLRNMAEFRENLRRMLATPGARLKDLIDVERELARVQSEMDSLATRRKALANETDKVHVTVAFAEEPSVLETGVWAPVHDALVGAGHLFASSLAGLISFVVASLPWVVALLMAGVGVRALWRRRRAAQSRA